LQLGPVAGLRLKKKKRRDTQMSDAWYYVENNAQAGPVALEQLRNFLLSPGGGKDVLVWRKGLNDWRAAGEMPELAGFFEGPPPIPPRPCRCPPRRPKWEKRKPLNRPNCLNSA
jgi:hypothetical protein